MTILIAQKSCRGAPTAVIYGVPLANEVYEDELVSSLTLLAPRLSNRPGGRDIFSAPRHRRKDT